MNRFNIPAIFKFAIGVLLVQGATVLLVVAAQQANLGTTWPLMLGARAILRIRPEAGACIETDMKPSARAIRCPL